MRNIVKGGKLYSTLLLHWYKDEKKDTGYVFSMKRSSWSIRKKFIETGNVVRQRMHKLMEPRFFQGDAEGKNKVGLVYEITNLVFCKKNIVLITRPNRNEED